MHLFAFLFVPSVSESPALLGITSPQLHLAELAPSDLHRTKLLRHYRWFKSFSDSHPRHDLSHPPQGLQCSSTPPSFEFHDSSLALSRGVSFELKATFTTEATFSCRSYPVVTVQYLMGALLTIHFCSLNAIPGASDRPARQPVGTV